MNAISALSASRWVRPLLIILCSALAHAWCLKSQFYLDDLWQIRDHDILHGTDFRSSTYLEWFYLCLLAQVKLFGMSTMAIHAVNWLLHTGIALVIYFSGREYLSHHSRGQGIAWFAALLFAVHPLGSEIPNYARTQDLAWVTLFSLAAAWMFLRGLREKKLVYFAACLVFGVGATFSKGPGLFHAISMIGMVALAFGLPLYGKWLIQKKWWLLAIVCLAAIGLYFLAPQSQWARLTADWGEPRFYGHGLTIARVFWEFTWRGFLPIHLSADHHIAETLVTPGGEGWWGVPDKIAWLSLISLALLTIFGVFLCIRKSTRILGMFVMLYLACMLVRFLYFVPEYMPEYRIYPGLPWFCLAFTWVLSGVWHWLSAARPHFIAVILLGTCITLSAKRSFQWHDLNILMADVLERYPTQARALWVLQRNDIDAQRWQVVIDRHRTMAPQIQRRFLKELQAQQSVRELPTGHQALAEVGEWTLYIRAVTEVHGIQAGAMELAKLEQYMNRLRLDPKAHLEHWIYYRHAKALLLEKMNRYEEALALIEPDFPVHGRKRDQERIQEKHRAQMK